MVDKEAQQKTGIRRLWEQIVGLLKWTNGQVRKNPLQFMLFMALSLTLCWLTWQAHRAGNMGLDNKTFWDWLELLIVPVILAVGAWWLRKSERETGQEIAEKNREEDRAIANDRRHQATLETYLDRMTDLLLEEGLRESQESEEVRSIARSRTLAVLRSLDAERKGHVVQFLQESRLIDLEPVVELDGAKLLGADLYRANLSQANLSQAFLGLTNLNKANLRGTDLGGVRLWGAHLVGTDLEGANLVGAHLVGADLSGANLRRATVTVEQLASDMVRLSGATLPDGTKLSKDNWGAEFEEWRKKQEERAETERDGGDDDDGDDDREDEWDGEDDD